MSENDTYSSDTERPPGQVCPNPDCEVDQRWEGFRGLACPECATKLVVACAKCDSGAVERVDGSPRCSEHVPELVADGGSDRTGPAAGSKICSECGYMYFSDWGHHKTCSRHPRSDRDD